MNQWEYGFHSFDAHAPTEPWTLATEMGKEGWELVGTTAVVDGWITYLFKRPIDPEAAANLNAQVQLVYQEIADYRKNLTNQQGHYPSDYYSGIGDGLQFALDKLKKLSTFDTSA